MRNHRTRRRASLIGSAVAVLAAGLFGVSGAPASADPTTVTVTKLDSTVVDTGIPETCARPGSGPNSTYTNPKWNGVDPYYDVSVEDPDGLECAEAITEFLIEMAGEEKDYSANAPQVLRAQLFSGTPDLTVPYEVFLDNIYITTAALAMLSTTGGTTSGLGSCYLREFLMIQCRDDLNGSIQLRDEWGNPIDLPAFPISGFFSHGAGTTWGNVFLLNEESSASDDYLDRWVLHHEQVHAQQWAKWGWDFAWMYAQDWWDSFGNANYHNWYYSPRVAVPAKCFRYYERRAGFQDGRYAYRDLSHDGWDARWDVSVEPGRGYPDGWRTEDNTDDKCPSNWT